MLDEIGATSQEISASDVRIWRAHLDSFSAAHLEKLSALLDAAEQERAARFHFERDRRHYVASRGLLRHLLGGERNESPSAVVFDYGLRGKPMIRPDGSDRILHFNISHSSGWALFALAWNREVGIDLECGTRLEREDNSLAELAARILSADELAVWRALPDDTQRRAAFLRAWTRKEAYLKATGQGIFDELDRLEVALDAAAPKPTLDLRSDHGGPMREWTLHDLAAPEGFAAALAIEAQAQADR